MVGFFHIVSASMYFGSDRNPIASHPLPFRQQLPLGWTFIVDVLFILPSFPEW